MKNSIKVLKNLIREEYSRILLENSIDELPDSDFYKIGTAIYQKNAEAFENALKSFIENIKPGFKPDFNLIKNLNTDMEDLKSAMDREYFPYKPVKAYVKNIINGIN